MNRAHSSAVAGRSLVNSKEKVGAVEARERTAGKEGGGVATARALAAPEVQDMTRVRPAERGGREEGLEM
jgi:hypothetical protein